MCYLKACDQSKDPRELADVIGEIMDLAQHLGASFFSY